MSTGRFTQAALRVLDWIAAKTLPATPTAEHLRTGRQGEEEAFFYLRRRGYIIIARNFRSPHHRGEIDLVGWDGDTLCVIEVKTRTTRDVKPAEAAVDRAKRRHLVLVARDFMRHMPPCPWRFDVLAIYYEHGPDQPAFELFQNAFPISYNRKLGNRGFRDFR